MTKLGADAAALDDLASRMSDAARRLESAQAQLGTLLRVTSWMGADADLFRGRWNGEVSARYRNASALLADAATDLRRQAGEQRQASAVLGVSGRSGGHAGAVCEAPPGFAASVRGTQRSEHDEGLAKLSNAIYDDSDVGDWKRLTDEQLQELGLDHHALDHRRSGFGARIYVNGDGQYVIVFAGTNQGQDWAHNLAQGAGVESGQYNRALALVKDAKRRLGGDLVVTGHSLGGGLAAYAAVGAGVPAVTFNAAGVNDRTLKRAGLDPQAAKRRAEAGEVRNYSVEGDLLTDMQTVTPAPQAIGTTIRLDNPRSGWERLLRGPVMAPIDAHSSETVVEAMEAKP